MPITMVLADDLTPEQVKVSNLLGDYEQPYFGNTLTDMVRYEATCARQELRDHVMRQLGCEYHYIECNMVRLCRVDV